MGWANALQGFGAGLSGNGAAFQLAQAKEEELRQRSDSQRREDLYQSQKRQREDEAAGMEALKTDMFAVSSFLEDGRPDIALKRLENRRADIHKLRGPNADTSHTDQMIDLVRSGNIDQAIKEVAVLNRANTAEDRMGEKGPSIIPSGSVNSSGQVSMMGPDGKPYTETIPGYQIDASKERDRNLRERQLAVSEAQEERMSNKLSSGLEKALMDAQDRVVLAQRQSNEYSLLANDFERLNLESGVKMSFAEGLKSILGTQDDVTEFRRRFNQVRLSEGLKNLPPGPATDKDMAEAFKGVPPTNASPEQVASFLRGAARMSRYDAAYNQFKADFISSKSSPKGLNSAWRKSVNSPVLGKSVSTAEIYETAQNRGITPEEVRKKLGIE